MSTTTSPSSLTETIPGAAKKKRVLLVDASPAKRDLRAEIMRKLGMEVDCASDIPEARCWWRADLYDLVLINLGNGAGHRDRFCDDLRRATPRQQIAFLVGKPEYLADSPNSDEEPVIEPSDAEVAPLPTELAQGTLGVHQCWGILEASRRISAVRSASVARTRAMRDRPAPARDSQTRSSKGSTPSTTLDKLLREEMR